MYYTHILFMFILILFLTELDSEKNGWSKHEYNRTFDASKSQVKDNVERVDASKVSLDEFREKYEKTYMPVVITHAQDKWMAQKKWTMEVRQKCLAFSFYSSSVYGHRAYIPN